MSRLDLVVGPNGAGKSTFVRLVVAPSWSRADFVNVDAIAAERWPEDPSAHAYDAARLAAATRATLIEHGRPLIAETVFSHPSKLDLIREAKGAGYYVALHVVMVPEGVSLARVVSRVANGGHDVPAQKISERFQRIWPLVAQAVAMVDVATFWDNAASVGPRLVALFSDGLVVGNPNWPAWTPAVLAARWPAIAGE